MQPLETLETSLSGALTRRLACYISANESVALAKLAAHTWLHIWVFSGHPSVRIGSLVTDLRERTVYIVHNARLKDSDVIFEALSLEKTPHRVGSSRDRKVLSNSLAIECIRCNDPERLEALDVALLEEVVASKVNAFHYAAALGNVDCLAVLIRKLGVSCPLLTGPDGKLASGVLCCCDARFPFGNREGVLHLLLHHFGLKSFGSDALQPLLKSASQFGALWLISFVFSRIAELEKEGVAFGVDLSECLGIASFHGNTDCARLLLEHGADVNAKDEGGYSALMFASQFGKTDCARLLLEHGADANARDGGGFSALIWASKKGHADCARLLLEHGADVNAESRNGFSALMKASEYGHTDCARLLLEHGADVNAKTVLGWTALMEASVHSHTDCVRLLLEHGAEVNAKNVGGGLALIWASQYGNTDCARLLLEHGADANAKDVLGGTALMEASFKGHTDCVRLLLEHGADVNAKDGDGGTALMEAHSTCIRLLKEHGAVSW